MIQKNQTDPIVPSSALKGAREFRQWLAEQEEPAHFLGSNRELNAIALELQKLNRKPRLSDLLPLLPAPRSQERPAEKSYAEMIENASARTRSGRREGWMACLRLFKRWSSNDGFDWNELVRSV